MKIVCCCLLLLLCAYGDLYAQKAENPIEALAVERNISSTLQVDSTMQGSDLGRKDGAAVAISKSDEVALKPAQGLKTLHIHGPMPSVLRQAFQRYGIDLLFSSTPELKSVGIDLGDADYFAAVDILEKMSHLLFVPLTEKKVLAVPDTKENREKYNSRSIETILLPHLDDDQKKSLNDFLQADFVANTPVLGEGSLTLRGDPATLAQVHSIIETLLLPQPQILLDVKIYSVDYSYDREIGATLPQEVKVFNVNSEITSLINGNQSVVQQLISEGLVASGDTTAIAAALIALGYGSGTDLATPFFYFGNGISLSGLHFGSASAALSFSSASTKEIRSATLRLDDLQLAKLLVGSRYPVKTSSFNYSATSSSSASSTGTVLASVEYEDLGLTFEVRPHILRDDDVLLHMNIKMQSLAGSGINDIPILNKQEFSSDLTVPNTWSTIIASNISNQQTGQLTGSGYVPTDKSKNITQQALVIMVTPRLTRRTTIPVNDGARLIPDSGRIGR